MSWRVIRLTQELKKHDKCLFAKQINTGMVQVWRQADKWDASDLSYEETSRSLPMQFITALTDTWKLDGVPVERGIEPVLNRIRHMDSWNQGSSLDAMRKRREKEKEDKQRQKRNENRAIAADLRKEFAAATNDINTASLDMTDARRKYGTS
jgi:hypothetical protein